MKAAISHKNYGALIPKHWRRATQNFAFWSGFGLRELDSCEPFFFLKHLFDSNQRCVELNNAHQVDMPVFLHVERNCL